MLTGQPVNDQTPTGTIDGANDDFTALETLRGKECSRRLLLVANCLKALAQQNGTKPGEKICEPLDLNYALDVAQGAMSIKGDFTYIPAFFRFGTEPDCPGIGDHVYNLNLDENGNIIPPRCTRIDGPRGEYFREHNLHVCDLSKVDGKITSSQIQSATP